MRFGLKRFFDRRQRQLQAAGAPALAAALILTISCCHGGGYGIRSDAWTRPAATAQQGLETPAATHPCHMASNAAAPEDRPDASTPDGEEACPGCNSQPVVHQLDQFKFDSDRLKSSATDSDADSRDYPTPVAAFDPGGASYFIAGHRWTGAARVDQSRRDLTGTAPIYLINQTFLI